MHLQRGSMGSQGSVKILKSHVSIVTHYFSRLSATAKLFWVEYELKIRVEHSMILLLEVAIPGSFLVSTQ